MAVKTPRAYLADLIEIVGDIEAFTSAGQSTFLADRKTQFAVIRGYELVGEIAKRLPQQLLDLHPEVNWASVKKFRDVLIHQYDSLDLSIVWSAVTQLPTLRAAVEAMIAALDAPPPESDPTCPPRL